MGSEVIRTRQDKKYLYYVYYDNNMRKEVYCGLVSDPESKQKMNQVRYDELTKKRIEIDNELESLQRELGLLVQ